MNDIVAKNKAINLSIGWGNIDIHFRQRLSLLPLILLVIGLTLAVFWQPLRWMVSIWSTDAYYSHGFLVPVIAVALVWQARHKLQDLPVEANRIGLLVVVLALLLSLYGVNNQVLFASGLGLPLFCAGLAIYLRGIVSLRYLFFPSLYLSLMIPMPFVNICAWQLQVWTSWLATGFANALGTPALQQGAVVSIPNAAYVVGIACSGLNSIVALLSLGTLIIYLSKGNYLARIGLVFLLIPIAIMANGFRIGSMLLIAYHFGGDAGLAYHDTVAGFISWGIALGFLLVGLKVTRCRFSLGG